jgi:hypothetical protein
MSTAGYADCVVCGASIATPEQAAILGESHPAVDGDDPGAVRYRHRTCDPSDYDPPEPTMWM